MASQGNSIDELPFAIAQPWRPAEVGAHLKLLRATISKGYPGEISLRPRAGHVECDDLGRGLPAVVWKCALNLELARVAEISGHMWESEDPARIAGSVPKWTRSRILASEGRMSLFL